MRTIALSRLAARFYPALAVCEVWLFVMARGSLWSDVFGTRHYVMSIAMIFGSLIAGSTPLGGGVVAFPVSVLVLGLDPAQGRDFTLLIQSVGMNAASYTIARTKPHLVDARFVSTFVAGGVPGVLLALALELPPYATVLTFQLIVLEFALAYAYFAVLAPRRASDRLTMASSARREADEMGRGEDSLAGADLPPAPCRLIDACMVCAAFVGGFFTGSCGSGSDIVLYAFGVLVWNVARQPTSSETLTASSVVVMGILSVIGAAARVLTGSVSRRVYLCWGAAAWVVCWGAPLGSLLLTPKRQAYLRLLFYVLAAAQFVGFAVLKMRSDAIAWSVFGACTLVVLLALGGHTWASAARLRASGEGVERLTPSAALRRLLA